MRAGSQNDNGSSTLVFDGIFGFTTSVTGPPTDVHGFDMGIAFQEHFNYDPRQGSLLPDLVITTGGSQAQYDAATRENVTDVVSFGNPTADVASDSYGWLPVTQFIFAERGDFNGDLAVDAADLDLFAERLRGGTAGVRFDVDDNGTADSLDHAVWVRDVQKTWLGDADLDGQFNSGDLVVVFASGQYEDVIANNSGWAAGDWNADGEFDSSDLVVAFQDGGYEQGPRFAVAGVPEPSSLLLLTTAVFAIAARRRRPRVTRIFTPLFLNRVR